MIWLRRIFHRRIVKGLEYRIKSLEDLMTSAEKQKEMLYEKLDALGEPDKNNEKSRLVYQDEIETWDRIFWDAYNRHEEVEGALMLVLKDFNRR